MVIWPYSQEMQGLERQMLALHALLRVPGQGDKYYKNLMKKKKKKDTAIITTKQKIR